MNEFDYYWDIFIRWMTTPIIGSDSGITISNMLGFVLIVFVAWWASAKVEKILQRMTLGKSYRHIDDSTFYLISRLFRYFIWISATLVGLSYIGFNLTGLAFIGGAIGVGIGFGLQNIVSNFISGIIILFERPIRVGDIVTVGDTTGVVSRIPPKRGDLGVDLKRTSPRGS